MGRIPLPLFKYFQAVLAVRAWREWTLLMKLESSLASGETTSGP
jgi:hypothetical protein